MRFRLATGPQGSRQIAESFGRGMDTIFQAPLMQLQGAEQFQDAQMKRDLAGAQIDQARAHAALFGQQAEAERQKVDNRTPTELIATAAMMNKVGPDQIPELQQYVQSGGHLAGKYALPADQQGPILPKPAYADPNGLGGDIMRTLGLLRGGIGVGGNIDNVTTAAGHLQQQDAVRQVQVDPSSAPTVARSFAASKGQKLVDNVGNTGRGYDMFDGSQRMLSPGLAVLFDKNQLSEISQHNAAAGASAASAAHSRALTDKTRQEIDQGQRTGNLQVVAGPDGTVTVVDKVNRTAQPVLGADGKPVIKGAAGGGGKPMTEAQAKANLFGARMLESDKILSELESKGVTNTGITRSIVQGTVGVLPLIGDKLSDAAGSGMNVLPGALGGPSSEQQQVDQARRDFINAVLRRESGAAISPSEFENANKQYFPQPGDSKQVLAQKRRNRQIASTLMLQEVPEAMRYKPGSVPLPGAPAPQTGGATGSWGDAPAANAGWSIQKVN